MKVSRFGLALIAILMLLSPLEANTRTKRSNSSAAASAKTPVAVQTGPGSPVGWMPFQESFAAVEGEAILIAFSVDCPSRSPTGHEVELLPPTPGFVHLSSMFVSVPPAVPGAIGIISVIPQPGDAGKYQIKVRATPCYGSAGSEVTFRLKVKKAQ